MKLKAHPQYLLLRARCRAFLTLGIVWEREVVRYAPLRYAKPSDLLSGEGSRLAGKRFNTRLVFGAVYTSLDSHTATAEVDGKYADYNVHPADIPSTAKHPQVRTFIDFRLQRVLDLCDRAVRRKLGVTRADLRRGWMRSNSRDEEAFTQALGRAARASGFEGLLVPSRFVGGINLVWFPGRLLPGSRVWIPHERELIEHLK